MKADSVDSKRRYRITVIVMAVGFAAMFLGSSPDARVAELFAVALVWANNVERDIRPPSDE